jgi:hypothetical protein
MSTIKGFEPQPTPLKKRTPAQLAQGEKCVLVWLPKAVTLELEGSTLVTFEPGTHDVPTEVSNILRAQGAELVGYPTPPAPNKPKAITSMWGSRRFQI